MSWTEQQMLDVLRAMLQPGGIDYIEGRMPAPWHALGVRRNEFSKAVKLGAVRISMVFATAAERCYAVVDPASLRYLLRRRMELAPRDRPSKRAEGLARLEQAWSLHLLAAEAAVRHVSINGAPAQLARVLSATTMEFVAAADAAAR